MRQYFDNIVSGPRTALIGELDFITDDRDIGLDHRGYIVFLRLTEGRKKNVEKWLLIQAVGFKAYSTSRAILMLLFN
jgi:hypothetical protein